MLQWTMTVHTSFQVSVFFSLDKYPEEVLLDYLVVLFLVFWGTVAAQIYIIPTNSARGFPPTLVISCLFWLFCFLPFFKENNLKIAFGKRDSMTKYRVSIGIVKLQCASESMMEFILNANSQALLPDNYIEDIWSKALKFKFITSSPNNSENM